MGQPHKNNWIVSPKPRPDHRLRLFCFPCAGGMVSPYTRWAKMLPADVELCIIHLPGRGKRFGEAPFTQLTDLLPVLVKALEPYTNGSFAFLGHSMGAVLGFEVARYLRQQKLLEPRHLFCCSCPAPQTPIATPHVHNLPEAAFIAELNRRYAAIPEAVQKERNILQLFLPSLRADFEMLETYQYVEGRSLTCPISGYTGLQDKAVSAASMSGWQLHTRDRFHFEQFPGDHFFIHTHTQRFLSTLTPSLRAIIRQL